MPRLLLTFFVFVSIACFLSSCGDETDSEASQPGARESEHVVSPSKETPAPSSGASAQGDASSQTQLVEALPIAQAKIGEWRAVWVQAADSSANDDVFLSENNLRLMVKQSGGEAHPVLDEVSNYLRPLITPNGEGIVYSNFSEQKHYYIPFSGGEPRELGEGFALEVWKDPKDGRSYVFAGEPSPIEIAEVFCYPLDDPTAKKSYWKNSEVSLSNFQLSRSGEIFGGLFPWPNTGVGDPVKKSWEKYESGCWPSLSPDESRLLWFFEGNHQNVTIADRGRDGEPTRRWQVSMNNTPALAGHEVYHPRWSNHPEFFAESGPYTDTSEKDASLPFNGGAQVEIYVGQFSPDLSGVSKWFRVTENDVADFCPDFWVKNGEEVSLDLATVRAGKPEGKIATEYAVDGWPGEMEGLVFLWDSNRSRNELTLADGTDVECSIKPVGVASYGRNYGIELSGGHGVADSASAARIVRALAGTGSVTLEFTAFAENIDQLGNPHILTLGTEVGGELLVLEQKESRFGVAIRTSENGDMNPQRGNNETWFDWNNSFHLAIRFSAGRMDFFRDGKTWNGFNVSGDLSTWANGLEGDDGAYLIFGNNRSGDGPWVGNLEKIAIYDQALPDTLMATKQTAVLMDLGKRQRPPILKMRAKLISMSPVLEPDSLGAYRRGLSVYTYEVLKVDSEVGYEDKTIRVAHWTVLDREKLRTFPRDIDGEYYLWLEPMEAHPQLKSERISDTLEDSFVPIYFDFSTPKMDWPQNSE